MSHTSGCDERCDILIISRIGWRSATHRMDSPRQDSNHIFNTFCPEQSRDICPHCSQDPTSWSRQTPIAPYSDPLTIYTRLTSPSSPRLTACQFLGCARLLEFRHQTRPERSFVRKIYDKTPHSILRCPSPIVLWTVRSRLVVSQRRTLCFCGVYESQQPTATVLGRPLRLHFDLTSCRTCLSCHLWEPLNIPSLIIY